MNENNSSPHTIEPELQRAAPRALKRRGLLGAELIFVRLFIVPHTFIGLALLLVALASTAVFLVGSNAPAQVTARNISRGKNTSYRLQFVYREAGALHRDSQDVSASDYDATPIGAAVQVRRLTPLPNAQLVMPSGNRYPNPLPSWGFALFWNGIVSAFLYMAWVAPWQRKKLVAQGAATEGQITGKEIERGRNTSYVLRYRYAPREYSQNSSDPFSTLAPNALTRAPATPPLSGTMNVAKADYEAAHEGDFVTIIYDQDKPKRSLIYRYAEFQCVA